MKYEIAYTTQAGGKILKKGAIIEESDLSPADLAALKSLKAVVESSEKPKGKNKGGDDSKK